MHSRIGYYANGSTQRKHDLQEVMNRILLALAVALGLIGCTPKEEVDLILHNGKIVSLDGESTVYQAMAIKDGKVVALGPEYEILNGYKATRVVDLARNYVYPGFIEAHGHLVGHASTIHDVDLSMCTSWEEVLDKVSKEGKVKSNGYIVGRGWNQTKWSNQSMPTNESLNVNFPNTPLVLIRIDGHAAVANNAALQRAGIDYSYKEIGGEAVRANGVLTGLVIDNAYSRVLSAIPQVSKSERVASLIEAQKECLKWGITTVDEAGIEYSDLLLIDSLQKAGVFDLRMYAMLTDSEENINNVVMKGPDTLNNMLRIRAMKFMVDGALGSRGACLKNPYYDVLPKTNGFILKESNYYLYKFALAYSKGFQVCTHAIGDSANKVVLQWYASILDGKNDKRWRVEHAQVVDSMDLHYFSENGIIPSVQPTHAVSDGPWAMDRLGMQRIKNAYAYKRLLNVASMLALGTDFPVEVMNPLRTFYAAVFRKEIGGAVAYREEEAIDRKSALLGMTMWPAIANFEENEKGTIEVGKLADFTVVSADLLEGSEDQLVKAKVMYCIIGGKVFSGGEVVK
jgi:predicted amidohydrolase YtcJ